MTGSADSFLLDFARGIAQPGSIDQMDGIALQDDFNFNGVARRTGVGGNNGPVVAGQQV